MNKIWPARNEVVWLVKSGDRILGPYSADTIEELLKSRDIVVIDEIKRSFERWKYIRDESFFAMVVEKMRRASQTRIDDTQRGTLSNPTATLTANSEVSRTLDLELADTHLANSGDIKDAEFIDFDIQPKATPSLEAATRQFGVASSQAVQKNIRKSSSTIWFFAFILVGILLTIAYKIQYRPQAAQQGPDFTKTFDLAVKNYRQGYFADALKYFKEAATMRPNDPDVVISMAPLLLSIEGQKVEVRRKIGEVLAIVHSDDQVKQAKNILGLAAIADEDFVEAMRQFEDALKIDSKYIPALFNSGIVHFMQKDYKEAQNDFLRVLTEDPGHAAASYLRIRAKMNLKPVATDEIKLFAKEFINTHIDLKQEVSLLSTYLVLKDSLPILSAQLRATLDSDPFTSEEFLHDPLLSLGQLSWIHLSGYCDEMMKSLSNSPDMKALYSICLVKTGRAQEAPKYIEEGLAQAPNDSLLLSVKAYLLMTSGRSDEAHAALELAKVNHPTTLSKILMGRLCMKSHDDHCVRENFEGLRFASGISLVGLAEADYHENKTKAPSLTADRSLRDYLPAIRLESEFGSN